MTGLLGLTPLDGEVTLQIQSLDLGRLPLPRASGMRLDQGRLNGKAGLAFSPQPRNVTLTSQFGLADLHIDAEESGALEDVDAALEAKAAVDVFLEAGRLNREDAGRRGSMLHLPDYGQVVMTGDLHGHDRNFHKLQKYADLPSAAARHVILHEIIHAEPDRPLGEDLSHQVMLEAAQWKLEFPDQVHFLHSNHEMAQFTGKEICKGGRVVTRDFERGLELAYGDRSAEVLTAVLSFIESFALAIRTSNRILLSHSLPNLRDLQSFDPGVVHRPLQQQDYFEGGDAYVMVWGRHHTPDLLNRLGEAFDVDFFICGHQPQETGYEIVHDRLIILASDHNHGVFLPFDLKRRYTVAGLVRQIRPLASIA